MDVVLVKVFFLKYLLLPLIVILLAIVLGYFKKRMPKIRWKSLIAYILIFSLCICLPGFFGFSGNAFNPYWYLFSMLIYMLLGILNVNLLKKYFSEPTKPLWFILFFESLITVMCMLFGGYLFTLIFNWVTPYSGYAFMASTSVSIFIVPLSFYYCFMQFISIPLDIYKTWQPSLTSSAIDFDAIEFNSLLVLNLEITKTTEDGKKYRIDAKAPSDGVSFGDWFYRVVDDYNHKYPSSTINLFTPDQDYYSWIFYTKKSIFHFRKFIDFDLTISENDIMEHTTILCKRVVQHELEDKILGNANR